MNWIFLALTAHLFWGLVNIGDKFIITSKFKNPYVYLTLLVWGSLSGLLLIPFIDFHFLDFKLMGWLLVSTFFYFSAGLFYAKSVKSEDISRINIWWNLIPFFSLVIAWLFIGERLSYSQLAAFAILMFGSFLASIKIQQKTIVFSKVFGWMLLSVIGFSITAVILRYIVQKEPFLVVLVWACIFEFILSLFLFFWPKFRHDFISDFKKTSNKVKGSILIIAILDISGTLFSIWALSFGPVALVYAMEGSQAIFVFLMVLLISFLKPKIIKEEFDKLNFFIKFIALLVIVTGVIMLNLS